MIGNRVFIGLYYSVQKVLTMNSRSVLLNKNINYTKIFCVNMLRIICAKKITHKRH